MSADKQLAFKELFNECFMGVLNLLTQVKEEEDAGNPPMELLLTFGTGIQDVLKKLEQEVEAIGRNR